METREEFQARWRREQRLRHGCGWPHSGWKLRKSSGPEPCSRPIRQGLSIREIAAAIGLSRARMHQLVSETAAAEVPAQVNRLREQGWSSADVAGDGAAEDLVLARLADEVTALRECLDWLERLEWGESVVVNLLPEFHDRRDFVTFDWPRILRRIAGALDELSRGPARRSVSPPASDAAAERRRRLAEPPPLPPRLSLREERAQLRAKLGLDP